MNRFHIGIVEMNEMKLTDEDDVQSEDYRVIYSIDKNRTTGVGIVLNKEQLPEILDRIILVNLKADPIDIAVTQI